APAQEQPRKLLRQKKEQVEPAEKPVPAPEAAPKPAEKPAAAEEAAPKPEAKPEQPAPGQTLQEGAPKPESAAPAGEKPAAQPELLKPAEKPAEGQQPAEQPAPSQQPAQGEQPAQGQQPAEGGVQGQAPAQDPNAPPLLDSQKERRGKGERGKGGQAGEQGGQTPAPADHAQQPAAPVEQGPPPTDDKAAQEAIQPEKIVPVTEEKGERRERPRDIRDRERPRGADVVKEIGDRLIIQFNNQTIVESNERPRMTRGARDVYYEDLPRGRTREIIERPNGVKVITIRNANGDIIRRSRIDDSGREYVLNYVDESYYDNVREWRDPGEDLPPLRLSIPRAEYILDSESVEEPADYYEFLEQPPVEKVTRLYSVDEVKRSARVRDIARRIDLDTLNFEFGSASIPDSEVEKLQGVADAMQKLLEKNPAETFLIEGHTDAVGSDNANLALSDERAEAVASALTNSFEIPPENLTTQGYGESYLKVDSSGPERENRRVAIRRITPLVAPVASAQ
ncbi:MULTISPECIES: OmpA family protein, partial [unclassified Mesorhizobium]|uniref:OmpA family protein n=1 Tax=unclassified Mesorhizobium TaxID=325217 RepID=UPI001FCD722C